MYIYIYKYIYTGIYGTELTGTSGVAATNKLGNGSMKPTNL